MGKRRRTVSTQEVDWARQSIRAAGLRCTTARLAVMEHLRTVLAPRTHAEVWAALADQGFDRATIYRNLTELTDARLLSRIDLGDHVWRFERRHTHELSPGNAGHPHFVCTGCGEVSCLDDIHVDITRQISRRVRRDARAGPRAHIGTVTEVLLRGRCADCG